MRRTRAPRYARGGVDLPGDRGGAPSGLRRKSETKGLRALPHAPVSRPPRTGDGRAVRAVRWHVRSAAASAVPPSRAPARRGRPRAGRGRGAARRGRERGRGRPVGIGSHPGVRRPGRLHLPPRLARPGEPVPLPGEGRRRGRHLVPRGLRLERDGARGGRPRLVALGHADGERGQARRERPARPRLRTCVGERRPRRRQVPAARPAGLRRLRAPGREPLRAERELLAGEPEPEAGADHRRRALERALALRLLEAAARPGRLQPARARDGGAARGRARRRADHGLGRLEPDANRRPAPSRAVVPAPARRRPRALPRKPRRPLCGAPLLRGAEPARRGHAPGLALRPRPPLEAGGRREGRLEALLEHRVRLVDIRERRRRGRGDPGGLRPRGARDRGRALGLLPRAKLRLCVGAAGERELRGRLQPHARRRLPQARLRRGAAAARGRRGGRYVRRRSW